MRRSLDWRKTASFRTCLTVVPGRLCPGPALRAEYSYTDILSFWGILSQFHCLYVHVSLDNWLFRHQDCEILLELTPVIVFSSISGVGSRLEISSLTTGQSFEALGFCFCSQLKIVCLAVVLLDKLLRDLNALMRSSRFRGHYNPS